MFAKSTMGFNPMKEEEEPSIQDYMKIFHEEGFRSTSDAFRDEFIASPRYISQLA